MTAIAVFAVGAGTDPHSPEQGSTATGRSGPHVGCHIVFGMAGAVWGLVFLVPKLLPEFSPLLLSCGRFMVYGAVSLLLLLPNARRLLRQLTRRDVLTLIRFALLGNLVYYMLLAASVQWVGIAAASLIIGVLPLSITWLGRRDAGAVPLARLAWPLLLVIGGVLCINLDALFASASQQPMGTRLLGVLCGVGALACWSWFAIENARYLKHSRFESGEWSTLWGVTTGVLGVLIWGVAHLLSLEAVTVEASDQRWQMFWLKRGVRSDAADLYRQQDLNVTLEHDYWGSSGTGGYSDLKAHTTMLQVDAPYSDGRMFFRSDFVNMNVGSFSTNADGKWDDNWGTCTLQDCSGNRSQSDSGASVAVGWRNDVWSWDIGTTPMGFNVVDVVGGISYSDDIGPLGYTVNAHRRPISSSLLAFGGQKDSPSNTGKKWGGVRADGVGLSLSYDKGEANGVWASLSGDQLTGKNVEDNWRVRWMTGYYYKVINQNNRRVTIGLNNMIWHYDKDLSGYSLGQGGYYSPQEYLSFAIPVMWRERTENWSWELGASGSWSHSRTKTMPRYPLMNLIPTDWQEEAARQSNDGGSSQGFGYTARALLERRVTSNWFVGTAIDIQQAKDYAPSHFLLYVRYSAAGWQGDMDLPPQPLIPYADW